MNYLHFILSQYSYIFHFSFILKFYNHFSERMSVLYLYRLPWLQSTSVHITLFISTAEYQRLMKILSSIIKKKHKKLKETSGWSSCLWCLFQHLITKAKKEVFVQLSSFYTILSQMNLQADSYSYNMSFFLMYVFKHEDSYTLLLASKI